jgi:hypothetical protein
MEVKRGKDVGPTRGVAGSQQSVGTYEDARQAVTTLPGMFIVESF